MKRLTSILLLLLAVPFATGPTAYLSSNQGDKTDARPKRRFKDRAQIRSSYNQLKDETTVLLDDVPIFSGPFAWGPDDLIMTVSYTYPGTKPSRPQALTFTFDIITVDNYERSFARPQNLTAKVDGQRLDLGTAKLIHALRLSANRERDVLALSVPYDLYARICAAKSDRVEINMSRTYFSFDERVLEALRDLDKRANK